MTKTELFKLAYDNGIDLAEGTEKGIQGIFLHWDNTKNKEEDVIFIDETKLPELTWASILKLVINGRDVKQFTRIIGYYSSTDNWNPSKIGELKDRRKGNYSVGQTA